MEAQSLPARVAILSEVQLYRDGLALLLSQCASIAVVARCGVDHAGFSMLTQLAPDVVLLEARTVVTTTLVADLRAALPHARVVAFGVGSDDTDAVTCIEAGVVGYVPRDGTADELMSVVLAAAKGEAHCTPRLAALLMQRLASLAQTSPVSNAGNLTAREREIAALLDDGLSNKEIAARLGIGYSTVKNHVHNLLGKLNARGRAHAAAEIRRGRIAV